MIEDINILNVKLLIALRKTIGFRKIMKLIIVRQITYFTLVIMFNKKQWIFGIWIVVVVIIWQKTIGVLNLNKEVKYQVKLGDGNLRRLKGKEVIAIQIKGGMKKNISDVLYVFGLA